MSSDKRKILQAIDFKQYFTERVGFLKPAGAGQVLAKCPFHEDTKASLSINTDTGLWNCKGCGHSGDLFAFHRRFHSLGGFKKVLKDLAEIYLGSGIPPAVNDGKYKKEALDNENLRQRGEESQVMKRAAPAPSKPKDSLAKAKTVKLPDSDELETLRRALRDNPDALDYLENKRGLTIETIDNFNLGFSTRKKRITIPVFDQAGKLINIRCYSLKSENKMISWGSGLGKATIYGLRNLDRYDPDKDLIICEGEFDRLVLCQAGFQAVTHTNGALSFQKAWAGLFKDRRVVLIYDADDGGRKGSEKTAEFLAGAVKSLKIVDLEKAGLVTGKPDNKDLSDLALSNPQWIGALQSVIDQTDCVDLPEKAAQGTSQDFIKIYEEKGVYMRPGEKRGYPISNFTLQPTRRIKTDGTEILEAGIQVSGSGPGADVVLWPVNWSTKAGFKAALGDLGAGWIGSEDEITRLKVLISLLPCPTYQSEPKLGIHKRDGAWILVATDKTLTKDGEIEGLIHWSDQTGKLKYETGKLKPAANSEVMDVADALLGFNEPSIMAGVVGWMMALPFKARLIEAVPVLRRQFPILLMWGERGAGKTKTADMIILPFYGDFEGARKIDEMTKYTLMLNCHSTNTFPLALDEYKPSKLSRRQVREVSSVLRASFDGLTGERGFSNQTGQGTRLYTYTAPIIVLGEQTLIEPALKERIIELTFTKAGRQGRSHIQKFLSLKMAETGYRYIRWSLGITDSRIADIWNAEFISIADVFEDRVRQNIATLKMGLRLWEKFLVEDAGLPYEGLIQELLDSVDASQKTALLDGGEKAQSDIDLIIEAFGTMISMRYLGPEHGRDYKIHPDGRLLLRLQTIYPYFKKWAKEYDFDGEVLDETSFKKRLKNEPYFRSNRETMRIISGDDPSIVKVWAIDYNKAEDAGLNLSGFGL